MDTKENIINIIHQLLKVSLPNDKLHRDESIKNLTPIDNVSQGPPAKGEPEFTFLVGKVTPKDSKFAFNDSIMAIVSKELYHYYTRLEPNEFIKRINKTIYDYIREHLNETKERNVPDEDNIWIQPNAAFVKWFQEKGIAIDSIESFIGSDDTQNEDDKYKRLEKDYESVNNQLNVANKKVVKYKRQARYKTGHISDKALEKMADSVRFKSSKIINFDKLGELLGCSGVTAKKVIADRLPYLLDPKDY